jgi:adenosine deaminase CECR1
VVLRKKVANDECLNHTIHNYFQYRKNIEESKLFEVLDKMPKGGVHHIHSMAAHCLDMFLEITYDDRVFFSDKYKLFKVFTKEEFVEEGYLRCNDMRKFFANKNKFDDDLKKGMLLNQDIVYQSSSSEIWKTFQHFFDQFTDVGKYLPFSRKLIKHLFESCIKQNVMVVEIRHTPGMIYNDEMHLLPFIDEMRMILEITEEIQTRYPNFRARIILTGLKLLGNRHIEKMFEQLRTILDSGDTKLIQLISGFDLQNQEDFSPPLREFAKCLVANQKFAEFSNGGPDRK